MIVYLLDYTMPPVFHLIVFIYAFHKVNCGVSQGISNDE